MKKNDCEVIQDLIPLYVDGCCSEATHNIVEEHLKECEKCKNYKSLISVEMMTKDDGDRDNKEPEIKTIKKGIRKIKLAKTLLISFLVAIFIFIFVVIPVRNQIRGEGICYTNIDEIRLVKKFFSAVEKGDYEKAFSYVDIKSSYNDLINIGEDTDADIEEIQSYGYQWYEEASYKYFSQSMQELEDRGFSIKSYKIMCIYEDYEIELKVIFENGKECMVDIHVENGKILPYISATSFEEDIDRIMEIYFLRFVAGKEVLQVLYDGSDFDWEMLFEEDIEKLD